jgi:hypothetical protein
MRAFCKSGRRLSVNEIRAEAQKRQNEMRDATRAPEMTEEEVSLEKLKVLAEKRAARKAATGQAGKVRRVSEEAARKAATGRAGKAKRVSEEAACEAATGQAGLLMPVHRTTAAHPRRATARRANRVAQPRLHAVPQRPPCSTRSSYPPPCSVAAFIENSEPHTRARPSVRLCAGPELARCVHKTNTENERGDRANSCVP